MASMGPMGGMLTLIANDGSHKAAKGTAYGASFLDDASLSGVTSGYDCITAIAVMLAEGKSLPQELNLVAICQGIVLRLQAVWTRWGVVHCTQFHQHARGLWLHFGLGGAGFTTVAGAPLVATPVRCFSTGLTFNPEVNSSLRNRPPGVYALPPFVRAAPSNPAGLIDIAIGRPFPLPQPVITDFQWPRGMQFDHQSHGITMLRVKDGLAEAVLRILSGGAPSHHQGLFNTARITEHDLRVSHIRSRM